MIKIPEYEIDKLETIIKAQNMVGAYKNYLNDVLKPAIECGDWDKFEKLDIGFTVTGESLGIIGNNNDWKKLHSFFQPTLISTKTLDFTLNGKVIERNLRNQLKALALKMIWLSPKDYSFISIYNTITDLKKFIEPILSANKNSFDFISLNSLDSWVQSDLLTIDFERSNIYNTLNKLYVEKKGLPFEVRLSKRISSLDFCLEVKQRIQYSVIPQRLYYLGLQKSESQIRELYTIRDELGKLSDYVATYYDKLYQGYAKYLSNGELKKSNGAPFIRLKYTTSSTKKRNNAFRADFLTLKSPTEASILELVYQHKPDIRSEHIDEFYPDRTLKIGNWKITNIVEARGLIKQFNGCCIWALMSRSGMRSDEIFHLHTVNGLTTETISKQIINVIHADLSKTARGSQSLQDEFVTTEIGAMAYEILQNLHSPLRIYASDPSAFFYKSKDGVDPISKGQIARHCCSWFKKAMGDKIALTNKDLIDLKISDPNISFNVGDDYEFSGHQLRRSFAYYLIGYELCAFPQLKQQFSHISMAMTRHYAKNASKFQKFRKQKQNLVRAVELERIDQKAQVYLNIYKKLSNKERVAGGKGKEFARNMMKAKHNLFKDKVDNDMLTLNYWKKQIRDQKRHIHAVAPGVYCTSTGCSLRTQVNLLECVDCKNDYIVDAVFAEAKRKEAEINMLWDIEHDELTPQTASEAYIKITAAERIMNDLGISYEPVVIPKEVEALLLPFGVTS
tara:strand:- start:12738 stop:14939 length:2202 start_codon:yes stop_codon:yes gene_type:complete